MSNISNTRYVRVFDKDGKLLTVATIYGYEYDSFVAKPRNILHVSTSNSHDAISNLVLNLPINLGLRTVNLADYPEYFI